MLLSNGFTCMDCVIVPTVMTPPRREKRGKRYSQMLNLGKDSEPSSGGRSHPPHLYMQRRSAPIQR